MDILNPGNLPGSTPGAPTVKELPVLVTMLIDHTRGKSVQLNHFAKTAQTEDIPDRPGECGFPDLVAGFRHLRNAEGITAAGEELLGTVKTKRYTLKTAEFLGGKGPCDVSVWIDPKSGLPVKVRLESDVQKKVDDKLVPSGDKSLIMFEDFQFDVKIKDDTFSMDVPKGYQTKAKESAPAVDFISHTVNLEQAMENAATAKTMKFDVMVPNLDANQEVTYQPTRMYFTETAVRTEMLNPGGMQMPDIKAVPIRQPSCST